MPGSVRTPFWMRSRGRGAARQVGDATERSGAGADPGGPCGGPPSTASLTRRQADVSGDPAGVGAGGDVEVAEAVDRTTAGVRGSSKRGR